MERALPRHAQGVVRLEGQFDRRDVPSQAARIAALAEQWRLSVPAIGLWVSLAATRLATGSARWTLEYDPHLHLISFEVYADGRRVYGVDDMVP